MVCGRRISSSGIGRPSMNRVTSQPSPGEKAITGGPRPTSAARRLAWCSTSRSIPSRPVSAPPIRRTKAWPLTSILKFWFTIPPPTATTFQVVRYESDLRVAQRICELAPGDLPKKAIFFSTGAEAVENAVKIARAATGREAIISFSGGFHGRTLLALSLTGTVNPYKQNFGPYAAEVYQAPFPYEYRGWSSEQALAALETLFESAVSPQRVAAIIIEPVLGEGGFGPAPIPFLPELPKTPRKHGILLIADDIQTRFGRTGKFFAIQHSGVPPDIITIAKSLAAGFPLSAVIGRADLMDAPAPRGLGGTYAGNPVACAAGLAVLDVMRDERLTHRAARIGAVVQERMRTLAANPE